MSSETTQKQHRKSLTENQQESGPEIKQNGANQENGAVSNDTNNTTADVNQDSQTQTTRQKSSKKRKGTASKSRKNSHGSSGSAEEPKHESADIASQTEWATSRIGRKNMNLSEYLRFLWYDNREQALRSQGEASSINIATLVKDVMGKAIDKLRTRSRAKIVAPFDSEDNKQMMQVADVMFRAKVMLEDPFPSGTFHLQTGLRNGLKDGQGLLMLNSQGLTMEERMEVVKKHRTFVDDVYFSPTRASSWMYKGLQQVFEPMQAGLVYNYYIHLHPYLREGKLFVNILATQKDSNDTTSAVVLITPAILVSGWLSSASLVHPFPRKQKPYSQHEQEMVERIQQLIDDGERLICLEVNVTSLPKPSTRNAQSALPTARPTNNFRHARSLSLTSARSVSGGRREDHIWNVNLGHVEQIVFEKLFSFEFMKEAKVSLAVFTLLQERCPQWKVLTPELCRTIMLSTTKDVHVLKTPADWFTAFVANAHKASQSGKCPQFFLPKVNMFAGTDAESFRHMIGDLDWMVRNVQEQPFVLAQLICQ